MVQSRPTVVFPKNRPSIDLVNPPVINVNTPTLTPEEKSEILKKKFERNPNDDIELPVKILILASIKGIYSDFLRLMMKKYTDLIIPLENI